MPPDHNTSDPEPDPIKSVAREHGSDLLIETRRPIAEPYAGQRARAVEHFEVLVHGLLEGHWLRYLAIYRESTCCSEARHQLRGFHVMLDLRVLLDHGEELGVVRAVYVLGVDDRHHRARDLCLGEHTTQRHVITPFVLFPFAIFSSQS